MKQELNQVVKLSEDDFEILFAVLPPEKNLINYEEMNKLIH